MYRSCHMHACTLYHFRLLIDFPLLMRNKKQQVHATGITTFDVIAKPVIILLILLSRLPVVSSNGISCNEKGMSLADT